MSLIPFIHITDTIRNITLKFGNAFTRNTEFKNCDIYHIVQRQVNNNEIVTLVRQITNISINVRDTCAVHFPNYRNKYQLHV